MYQCGLARVRHAAGFRGVIGLIACAMLLLPGMAGASPPARQSSPVHTLKNAHAGLGRVQVPFIENDGQLDPRVAFYARTFAGTAFVTHGGKLVIRLPGKASRTSHGSVRRGPDWALVEAPVRAAGLHPAGAGRTRTNVSDFEGRHRSYWHVHLKTYAAVHVGQPWPGIRYDIHARGNNVERFFTVAPGSTAGRIRMRVRGASRLALRHGALVASTGVGDVVLSRPRAYQVIHGKRTPVAVAYVVKGHTYGFRLGAYDHGEPVTIDPQIQTASLASANGWTSADAVALGAGDEVYVAGKTSSDAFPGVSGGAQPTYPGGNFADFVAMLSPDLSALQQATYLPGGYVSGMVIGPSGQVYVAGTLQGASPPALPATSGAAQTSSAGGNGEGFVIELAGDLKSVTRSTYIGGSDDDYVNSIALGPNDNLYLAGDTYSTDFPMTSNGAQPTNAGESDAFLAEVSPDLTAFLHATYAGQGLSDTYKSVAVDSSGEVYATGSSQYADSQYGLLPIYIVVARYSSDLGTLDNAYVINSSGLPGDEGDAITLAPDGSVYIAGTTQALTVPGTAGGAQDFNWQDGRTTGYVAHLSHDLSTLEQATFVGGSQYGSLDSIEIDGSGHVLIGGSTSSGDFPITPDAIQSPPPVTGNSECTLTELTPDLKAFTWSTYLDGTIAYTGTSECTFGPIGSVGQLYAAGGPDVARFDASLLARNTTPTLTVNDLQDLTVNFNTAGTVPLTLTGSQLSVTAATSNISSDNAALLPDANISVQGNCVQATNCSILLTPAQGQVGTAHVRVVVTDGSNNEIVRPFVFEVNPPPLPTITGVHNVTITKGSTTSVSYSFDINGTGPLQTTVSVGGAVSKSTGQSACTSAGPCTLTLTPASGFTGTSKVIIDLQDSYDQYAAATFTFTIKNPSMSGGGGGGGGGALGWIELLALAALAGFGTLNHGKLRH